MTEDQGMFFKGFTLGGVMVAIAATFVVACSGPPPRPQTRLPDPKIDLAAIQFYDCGELAIVVFIKETGGAEGVTIKSPGHLDDTKLRVSKLPYLNVHYYENSRPCGFSVDGNQVEDLGSLLAVPPVPGN